MNGAKRKMNKPCTNCRYANKVESSKLTKFYPNSVICLHCEKYQKYLEFRKSKCKYKKGKRITSIQEFEKCITQDKFVYWGTKIYHAGWIGSFQYRFIRRLINSGWIYKAVKK